MITSFGKMVRKHRHLILCLWLGLVAARLIGTTGIRANQTGAEFVDLSLLVASDLPCTWPQGWPWFQINHYLRIGPHSPYNSDILTIDGNTGTQLDVPPHSVPPPDSKLPNAGRAGSTFVDKAEPWQFGGEACVIDVRPLLDKAANGQSSLIGKEHLLAWEKQHRPLRPGDVVLFHSGYSDRYYRPFPEGQRFLTIPLEGRSPAWPDPLPETMEYLASRGVMALGTDSPSMGPVPDLAEPTHLAGLKHGMIWTEGATGLGRLPATGAFYCMLTPKHAGASTSEGRAFAVIGEHLTGKLIESTRNRRVLDLSVTLAPELPVSWPGPGVGNHRQPYITANLFLNPVTGHYQQAHILDSHSGTHLVPPAYALPPRDFDNQSYSPEVQKWLTDYEKRYGPRGTSDVTVDKVPISQTCGRVRVIDVRHLAGTTVQKTWPLSSEITEAEVRKHEREHGELKPGEIVIFHSGYSDRHCQSAAQAASCMSDPLNGKSEGWPAPSPNTIFYLAKKGIRCVGTDGPTLGGTDPKRALMIYWALGTKGMVAVENLVNLGSLPRETYFLFAAVKVRNAHGGPGRAIALY